MVKDPIHVGAEGLIWHVDKCLVILQQTMARFGNQGFYHHMTHALKKK